MLEDGAGKKRPFVAREGFDSNDDPKMLITQITPGALSPRSLDYFDPLPESRLAHPTIRLEAIEKAACALISKQKPLFTRGDRNCQLRFSDFFGELPFWQCFIT